ncbi:uncharacterized protein LOC117102417 [Anneissia japonica]|uniref:uncharacterized protein LOC117102417 n=1 Tax=Anneissia japonica TaxID=1529436 RepID=UPI00142551BC|nr:uncharacterized protein LOC117102417 [Anneissia japonica]
MTIKLEPSIFWTDSQTVLKYISNEKARYPVFVANRVAVIRDGSTLDSWRYVPGKLYPADHASRGLKAQDLMRHKEWISGPDFLAMSQKEWPVMEDIPPNGNTSHNDIQESQCNAIGVNETIYQYDSPLNRLLRHYSDWTKLKRAVAYYIILKDLLRKVKESHLLTARNLEEVEIAISKYVQTTNFPQRELGKGSNLTKLNPKLNEGILRVGGGGRIENAPIPENMKHQIILPRDHHVTTLIIQHIHKRIGHKGLNHVLSVLRQKYLVLKVGTLVRSIVKQCTICRRVKAKSIEQLMANLPAERVQPDAPFANTGIDYFGPFEVKYGRACRKRYGVIFTCMACRAVHIEVPASMDTSSCINALPRFIARRGQVKHITLDNGTNFVGAEAEFECIDKKKMQEFARKPRDRMEI